MRVLDRKRAAMLAVFPALVLGSQAFAQQAVQPEQGRPSAERSQAAAADAQDGARLAQSDVRASELIGKEVKNAQNEKLGTVDDLVLDVEHAHVRYVVVAYGGLLGLGDSLAAFPVSRFQTGPEDALVLNVSRADLEKAPSFKESAWPDLSNKTYTGAVDRLFLKSDELVREQSGGGQLTRASDLIGKDVSDGGNRNAGKMEDLVVNLSNGQIRFTVLQYATRLNTDRRLVALPVDAFRFPSRPDLPVFLLLDRERVASARTFDEKAWAQQKSGMSGGTAQGEGASGK